jgi:hypothetical protein
MQYQLTHQIRCLTKVEKTDLSPVAFSSLQIGTYTETNALIFLNKCLPDFFLHEPHGVLNCKTFNNFLFIILLWNVVVSRFFVIIGLQLAISVTAFEELNFWLCTHSFVIVAENFPGNNFSRVISLCFPVFHVFSLLKARDFKGAFEFLNVNIACGHIGRVLSLFWYWCLIH